MLSLMRDSVWQFIGAIIALSAIIISIIIAFWQRKKKSICYKKILLRMIGLESLKKLSRGKISIIYNDQPIDTVYALVLTIINDGNTQVLAKDFERPITFIFGEDAEIANVEISEKSPDDLEPSIDLLKNRISIAPLLLNPNDTFTLQVLFAKYDFVPLRCDTRIAGIRKVTEYAKDSRRTIYILMSILGFASGLIFVKVLRLFHPETEKDIVLIMILLVLLTLGTLFAKSWFSAVNPKSPRRNTAS